MFPFNRRHKLQGKRYKLASTSFRILHLSFTLGNLQKITKIASRLWKLLCVNTVEGAILFIYAPCCSKVREEFGVGIGLESLQEVDSGNNMELKMVKPLTIPTRHYMVSMMVLYCFTYKAVKLKAPRQAGRLYEICHERCTSGLADSRICSSS